MAGLNASCDDDAVTTLHSKSEHNHDGDDDDSKTLKKSCTNDNTSSDTCTCSTNTNIPPSSSNYRNNPNKQAPLRVDADAPIEIMTKQIYCILQEILPEFLLLLDSSSEKENNNDVTDGDDDNGNIVIPWENLSVKTLEGGLSNRLFVVTRIDNNNNSTTCTTQEYDNIISSVLIRIHKDSNDTPNNNDITTTNNNNNKKLNEIDIDSIFLNRNIENQILATLSQNNAAPIYYGRFLNGRIEEFYNGVRPLSYSELKLPDFAVSIAVELARLHCMDMTEAIYGTGGDGGGKESEHVITQGGEIWERIDQWVQLAQTCIDSTSPPPTTTTNTATNDSTNDTNHSTTHDELITMVDTIRKEWTWLKQELQTRQTGTTEIDVQHQHTSNNSSTISSTTTIQEMARTFCRQVVFTHMDCQSLNILTPCCSTSTSSSTASSESTICTTTTTKTTTKTQTMEQTIKPATIKVIDFEYAGLNPRAADIGNTFCEHVDMNNLKADFVRDYPTVQEQNRFLISYVRHVNNEIAQLLDSKNDCQGYNGDDDGIDIPNAAWNVFLKEMRTEVGKHSLLSHLGWACWSIAQSYLSCIEFDYKEYARVRMRGYAIAKEQYW